MLESFYQFTVYGFEQEICEPEPMFWFVELVNPIIMH